MKIIEIEKYKDGLKSSCNDVISAVDDSFCL